MKTFTRPAIFYLLFIQIIFLGTACTAADISLADGKKITFSAPFSRIISLYPAHTENIAAMGGNEQLIGISKSDSYPPAINSKQRFSHRDNLEKFLAATPDLVLVRPMIEHACPGLLEKLQLAGITVISLQPRNIEEMLEYWTILGQLIGREKQAAALKHQFIDQLAVIRQTRDQIQRDKRPVVYFESIHSRMKTFSPESITLFVLDQAGGINAATDAVPRRATNIAAYGKERILFHANKIDVYLAQVGRMNRVTREEIIREPGFQAIRAVSEGKVYLIDETLVSRPTIRLLIGIEKVREILYPKK